MKKVYFAVPLVFVLTLIASDVQQPPPNEKDVALRTILDASVIVRLESDGFGSGIAFRNGDQSYIWTDAHVVAPRKKITKAIDPASGKEVVRCEFGDVVVAQQDVEDGVSVGEVRRTASIIRFSEVEDIAVLRVHKKNWPASGVRFATDVPTQGEALWHVGSMFGPHGIGSLSDGIFSVAGRKRRGFAPNEINPILYDQVSLTAHPGSSGGGVFRKKTGECVGLITEPISNESYGAVIMTPSRRLLAFAKKHRCEFAVNDKVVVPVEDREHVMRDDIPVAPPSAVKLEMILPGAILP